ncbi:MAG: class I SAM-dependent methyltransferase [Agarilytica sp.]
MKKSSILWEGYDSFYSIEEHACPRFLVNEDRIQKFGLSTNALLTAGTKFGSMLSRDNVLTNYLKNAGVKNVCDIGGDIGGFASTLKNEGVDCLVYEPDERCHKVLESLDIKYSAKGVQDIVEGSGFPEHIDAITCMNFTHVPWADEQVKIDLFKRLNESGVDVVIVSLIGDKYKSLFSNYEEDKKFNPYILQFRALKAVQYLVRRLRMEWKFLDFIIGGVEYFAFQRAFVRKASS